ncbi:MAG: ATP-binding protein [Actinomycetota bacterium]|nr:ATP-binding protein [Actinomycetota bacterium]
MAPPDRPGKQMSAPSALVVASAALVALALSLVVLEPILLPLLGVVAIAGTLVARQLRTGDGGLQIDQIERLREAELALASVGTTKDAARRLADLAIALLGAPSATVIIEGIGDTVRMTAGDTRTSVFGTGSRMRLLDDDGVPCGSIAVAARRDGRPYSSQQERMLDALAQRVSSTLHRLSLLNDVQSERRTLRDVFGSSSDGIFSVGSDLVVRSWNPAMAVSTGIPTEEAVGRPVSEVFRPVDQADRPVHTHTFMSDHPGELALVRVEGAGGEERWLTCSWSPLPEGGYVTVARDETERKKLQDDKDGWIAQVSHELRTPLTPIKGFLHTLQRREEQLDTADRQRIYEVMLREELRLENLVNGLLQATSIESGGLVVSPREVAWADLVGEQVDLYRHSEPPRRISLAVDPAVGEVLADSALATSVVTNLLSNALKYSPPDTTIEVTIEREDDVVVTTVSDHGQGIAPGDRNRIFDKFTRVGNHLTRTQQGVGLGLYIARRSVEQLGGTIWCDDTPGGGARFGFTLPAVGPAPAAPTRGRKKKLVATTTR